MNNSNVESTLSCTLSTILSSTKTNNARDDDDDDLCLIPKKLFFGSSPNHVCLLLSSHTSNGGWIVVVWNVTRGVVVHTIDLSSSSTTATGDRDDDHDNNNKNQNVEVYDVCCSNDNKNDNHDEPDDDDDDDSLYVLLRNTKDKQKGSSRRLYVYQYSLTTGKLCRKIKSGLHLSDEQSSPATTTTAASLVVSKDYIVVRHNDKVRVLSRHDGHKVAKIKLSTSGGGDSGMAIHGSNLAIGTSTGVVLYSVEQQAPNEVQPLGQIYYNDGSVVDSIVFTTSDRLLVNYSQTASAALYQCPTKGHSSDGGSTTTTTTTTKTAPSLAPLVTMETLPNVEMARFFLVPNSHPANDDDILVSAVLYSSSKGIHIVRRHLSNHEKDGSPPPSSLDTIRLGFPSDNEHDDDETDNKTSSSLKRISSHQQQQSITTTLGPGQAGGEALQASDRAVKRAKTTSTTTTAAAATTSSNNPRANDEASPSPKDISIAERLRQLAQEMERGEDEEDEDDQESSTTTTTKTKTIFHVKKATTESLYNLLKQALTSGDDAMLELSLGVRDKHVIATSLQQLNSSLVELLLTKLTTRLSGKPTRASELSVWISLVLQSGKIHNVQQLRPLRNLLAERVESFPHLLKLEGRLSVLAAMK